MTFLLRSQPPDGNLVSWSTCKEQQSIRRKRRRRRTGELADYSQEEKRGPMMLEVENRAEMTEKRKSRGEEAEEKKEEVTE